MKTSAKHFGLAFGP